MSPLNRIRSELRTFTSPSNLGEWVVSYRFWIGVAIFRIPFMDQRFLANHDNYLLQKLPILLFSYLVSGIPLYIASKTIFRHRLTKQVNPLIGCAVWFVSDVVLTLTAVQLLGKAQLRNPRLGQPVTTIVHALGQVGLGATIMFAVCLYFLGRQQSRDLRASVVKQSELLIAADAYRVSIRETYANQVTGSILPGFERIKSEVAAISGSRLAKGKLKDFADRVKDFSLSEVRNLGHQIAASEVVPLNEGGVRVQEIVEKTRLSPLVLKPANPFLTAATFLAFALLVNPDSPAWVILADSLVIWCAADICARLHNIYVDSNLSARLAILTLSLVLPVALAFLTNTALDTENHRPSIAYLAASVLVLTSLISYPYRFYAEVATNLQSVTEQISSLLATVRVEADEIRDSFSRFVHGKIQGRLALVSFILGQIASGELKGREKTKQVGLLLEILDTIETDTAALTQSAEIRSLSESIERLESEWAGLIKLRLELRPKTRAWLRQKPAIESQTVALIEEAIFNARVHGQATEVSISAKVDEAAQTRLKVEVSDNGKGLDANRTPGLGSRQFSAVCESWSLTRVDDRLTRLSAVIVEAQP